MEMFLLPFFKSKISAFSPASRRLYKESMGNEVQVHPTAGDCTVGIDADCDCGVVWIRCREGRDMAGSTAHKRLLQSLFLDTPISDDNVRIVNAGGDGETRVGNVKISNLTRGISQKAMGIEVVIAVISRDLAAEVDGHGLNYGGSAGNSIEVTEVADAAADEGAVDVRDVVIIVVAANLAVVVDNPGKSAVSLSLGRIRIVEDDDLALGKADETVYRVSAPR